LPEEPAAADGEGDGPQPGMPDAAAEPPLSTAAGVSSVAVDAPPEVEGEPPLPDVEDGSPQPLDGGPALTEHDPPERSPQFAADDQACERPALADPVAGASGDEQNDQDPTAPEATRHEF
jgi:hypothetical protein